MTAQWLTARGLPATAWRLGEINHETAYILRQAGCDAPAPLTEPLDGRDVWLVDFSDAEQGPAGLAECRLLGLIDHHRLGSLTSAEPIDAWIRRVGSTATLLWQIMTQEYAMVPDRCQATLLLGAILSDTVGLISATATEADRRAVAALSPLCGVDDAAFLDGLLVAKTCLDGYTPRDCWKKISSASPSAPTPWRWRSWRSPRPRSFPIGWHRCWPACDSAAASRRWTT
ncbi:DHH family phosphoesterase [Edwardsiella anguillarum]|nr:DHH family phosphoesterase [Edwardsiella anguillarum]